MPLPIRSIQQRIEQIIADVQNQTGQIIPPIPEAWDYVWAAVIAGMTKINDLAIARAAQNVLPSKTQDAEVLSEFAGWGDTPRGDSVQAILNVSGTGVVGETIGGGISGIQYVSDDGQKFYFENDFLIPSASFTTQITAYLPGAAANLKKGELAITGQNAFISSVLTIDEASPIFREGRDEELFESWRANVNRSLQQPVLPDNYAFFYETSRQTPGGEIVAGYAYVERPGQLDVYVESATNNGEPSGPQVDSVLEWFDGTTDGVVRIPPRYEGVLPDDPNTNRFNIRACTSTLFAVKVYGMKPNTETNQTIVGEDIINWFETRKPFIRGVSVENTGILDVKALTSILQNRVEQGTIQSFDGVEFSLGGNTDPLLGRVVPFVPISQYPLGKGELADAGENYIEWLQ